MGDWSDVATSQGKPGGHQKLEEARKGLSLEHLEVMQPC